MNDQKRANFPVRKGEFSCSQEDSRNLTAVRKWDSSIVCRNHLLLERNSWKTFEEPEPQRWGRWVPQGLERSRALLQASPHLTSGWLLGLEKAPGLWCGLTLNRSQVLKATRHHCCDLWDSMCLSLAQECWEIPLLTTSFTPATTPSPGGDRGRQDERAGDSLGRADTALAERGCLQLGPAWPSCRSLSRALSLSITLASFILVLQCLWLSVPLTTCSDSAITSKLGLWHLLLPSANLLDSSQRPLLQALLLSYSDLLTCNSGPPGLFGW